MLARSYFIGFSFYFFNISTFYFSLAVYYFTLMLFSTGAFSDDREKVELFLSAEVGPIAVDPSIRRDDNALRDIGEVGPN